MYLRQSFELMMSSMDSLSFVSSKELCENTDEILKNKPHSPVFMNLALSETLRRIQHLKKNGHISPKQAKDTKKLFE